MKIGELAQVAQTTVETVRYYEKEGLLPEPARTAGNFRVYGPEHVERLRQPGGRRQDRRDLGGAVLEQALLFAT